MEHFDEANDFMEHFYSMLFFLYENADDPAAVCQRYADLNRYADELQQKRRIFLAKSFNTFLWRIAPAIIFNQINAKATYLFHWLFVLMPGSDLVKDHGEKFAPLPAIPKFNGTSI